MNIFITGATGFIGRQLTKKLVENNHTVSALVRNKYKAKELTELGVKIHEGDVTDTKSIEGALRGCDTLFHLANISRWWLRDKNKYIDVNVTGTKNLLVEASRAGVRKVIFTSSVAAIRQPHGVLSREDLEHCGEFESLYGKSKYLAEQEVLKFAKTSNLDISVLNPGVVIGPGDFKTFGKILIEFLNRRLKFRVFDESYVPLVYIDDVVDAHIVATEKAKLGEKYILVSENMKIIDIYKMAHEITGDPVPALQMPPILIKTLAHFMELKAGITGVSPKLAVDAVNAMRKGASASNEKATGELGIKFMPIRQALGKTIDWYRQNGYVG
ncbi:MAG: SDR family NAD(P)-dependent oxidoreductase [Candidatus Dadabacteria bacterium]|nr:SDR family NAD(P)-dependent oxidoreductase [Candidatus Dadabacteria bacterium]NIX15837.1 SDR family NAD(P)-dependent oxidoreductase [Candidatus Dadabacteria bacterium]NIY22562.1 SDR family NAD(P)-dependent oxidoreductase [Candidatus Dadabacteria bacterium]